MVKFLTNKKQTKNIKKYIKQNFKNEPLLFIKCFYLNSDKIGSGFYTYFSKTPIPFVNILSNSEIINKITKKLIKEIYGE